MSAVLHPDDALIPQQSFANNAATLTFGPFDVSEIPACTLVINPANSAGAGVNVQLVWQAAMTGANPLGGGGDVQTQFFSVRGPTGAIQNPHVLRFRNHGGQLTVMLTPSVPPPTNLTVALYANGEPARYDGPYTPGMGGRLLLNQVGSIAANLSVTVGMLPYVGRAQVLLTNGDARGVANLSAQVTFQTFDYAGTLTSVAAVEYGPATNPNAVTQELWLPPGLTQAVVANMSTTAASVVVANVTTLP